MNKGSVKKASHNKVGSGIDEECKSYIIKEIDIHPHIKENAITFLSKKNGFLLKSNSLEQDKYLHKYTIAKNDKKYYSTFKVTDKISGYLNFNHSDYSEIVVYSDPPFKNPIFSTVNTNKIDFSFLPEGEYSITIFSSDSLPDIDFTLIPRNNSIKPPTSSLRVNTRESDELRQESIENCLGKNPLKIINSKSVIIFPTPVHTYINTIENLETKIPPNCSDIYAVVPSYGIVNFSDNIKKTVFHEFNSTIIYKLVIDKYEKNDITVIYTGMSENILSPEFKIYLY